MSAYPSRIVCLTEETTETLYLLGEGDRIVGVSRYTIRPHKLQPLNMRRDLQSQPEQEEDGL